MSESVPLRVALVGGGIAGLAAAVGFLKNQKDGANIKLTIYETAPKFGEIGAGVSVGPNAGEALRLMGAGHVLEKASGSGDNDPGCWFDFMMADSRNPRAGEFICEVRSRQEGKYNINVHRADFLDELVALVPSGIAQFNRRCVSYDPTPSGVTLNFADGTTEEADVVVASDGIKSVLRAHMYTRLGLDLESQVAKYSEWVAWRGLIPREVFDREMGEGANPKMMHCGENRHILHFPVRGGKVINIVGFVRDTEHLKLNGRTGPWTEYRPHSELLEDYKDFTSSCKGMLKAIENPSIWGIFELPPIDVIQDGRVILIGDAAHAMTPHQGAGAGQAIEDGLFISAMLSAVGQTPVAERSAKLDSVLSHYKEVRHARGLKVQKTSREAGLLYEFQGVKGEGSDMDKMKANLEVRMEWIWEKDLEKAVEEAIASI